MPLIDLDEAISESMRRWFGLSLGIVFALIAYVIAPSGMIRSGLLIAAGFVPAIYYLVPQSKLPIIRGWQRITYPLAWTVGHLLFGMVFFLVLTPIGLALRIFKYDPLRLSKNRQDETQWIDRPVNDGSEKNAASRHFRQY